MNEIIFLNSVSTLTPYGREKKFKNVAYTAEKGLIRALQNLKIPLLKCGVLDFFGYIVADMKKTSIKFCKSVYDVIRAPQIQVLSYLGDRCGYMP